jgi:hypothetical protein
MVRKRSSHAARDTAMQRAYVNGRAPALHPMPARKLDELKGQLKLRFVH